MNYDWSEPRENYLPTEDEKNHIRFNAGTANLSWLESQLEELAKDPESTRVVMADEFFRNLQKSAHDAKQQKALWEQEIKREKYKFYEEAFRKRYLEMGIPGKANMYRVKKKKNLSDILAVPMYGAAQLGGFVLFFYGVAQGKNYFIWAGIAVVFGVMVDWRAWGRVLFKRGNN